MYWTLLTPTYLAQLIAGTSNTDMSWSVSEPISPTSIGMGCCVLVTVWCRIRVVAAGVVGALSPRIDLLSTAHFVSLVVGSLRVGSVDCFVYF